MSDEIVDPAPAEPVPAAAAPQKLDLRVKYAIAGIALAATLFGALIGAGASIYVANRNADTQTTVAQYNFLHNQRQTAYVAFMTDLEPLRQEIESYHDQINGLPGTEPVIHSGQVAYNSAHNKMIYDSNVILIIGSPTINQDVRKIVDNATSTYELLVNDSSDKPGQAAEDKFSSLVAQRSPLTDSYLNDARDELTALPSST